MFGSKKNVGSSCIKSGGLVVDDEESICNILDNFFSRERSFTKIHNHIVNHAGTKVQLLEKAFVYSVSVNKKSRPKLHILNVLKIGNNY